MNPNDPLLRAATFKVGLTTRTHSQFKAVQGASFDLPANGTDLRLTACPAASEGASSPAERSR